MECAVALFTPTASLGFPSPCHQLTRPLGALRHEEVVGTICIPLMTEKGHTPYCMVSETGWLELTVTLVNTTYCWPNSQYVDVQEFEPTFAV